MTRIYITRSRFKLIPVFSDKREQIENSLEPFVRIEWLSEVEGILVSPSFNVSYLYRTEHKITSYVEWLGRTESIEEIGDLPLP